MARHKKRRGYGDVVSLKLNGVLAVGKTVNATDVYAGVAAGLAGVGAVKYLVNNVLSPTLLPAAVHKFVPALAGIATGLGLYFAQKKSSRATGHMVGAISTGVAITAMDMLREKVPALASVDTLRLGDGDDADGYNGLLVNDQGMHGLLVNDQGVHGYADNPELEELAQMSAYGSEEELEIMAP